jgi:hypothetical protein
MPLFRLFDSFEVGDQQGTQALNVDGFRAVRTGVPHPNDNHDFDPEIKGDQVDKDGKNRFKDIQKGKDHPIREPLGVVLGGAVHGLETHVSRVEESNQINNQFSTTHQRQKGKEEHAKGDEKVRFRITRLRFQLLEAFFAEKDDFNNNNREQGRKWTIMNSKRQMKGTR